MHQYFTHFAEASGGGGVLRFTVLGETRVVLCEPEAVAAALNRATFLPKPAGMYNTFYMFVRLRTYPPPQKACKHASPIFRRLCTTLRLAQAARGSISALVLCRTLATAIPWFV